MENNHHNPENDPTFGFPNNQNPGKRNVFSAPVNYFDKLPIDIADKIHSQKNASEIFSGSVPKLIGFATLIAIIIIGGVLLYPGYESPKISEPDLSYDDLINSELVGEIDESMFVEAFAESHDLSEHQTAQKSKDIKDIEDYLIDNNTDIALIINEL